MIKAKDFDGKISIITAVYNAADCIHYLIESLRMQTDQNFEWVVVDGLSTDSTLETLKQIVDLNIKIISEADFGIYDALNKGIKACEGEYYLVAGADDIFYSNAVEDYKNALEGGIDMVTAQIKIEQYISKPSNKPSWWVGQFHWVSAHALGVLIRKELHHQYGYYSRKFPIAADQLFIKKCCQSGVKVKYIDCLVGEFGLEGVSSYDTIGTCTEAFRVQLLTEKNKWIQYILFILKLTKRMFIRF